MKDCSKYDSSAVDLGCSIEAQLTRTFEFSGNAFFKGLASQEIYMQAD